MDGKIRHPHLAMLKITTHDVHAGLRNKDVQAGWSIFRRLQPYPVSSRSLRLGWPRGRWEVIDMRDSRVGTLRIKFGIFDEKFNLNLTPTIKMLILRSVMIIVARGHNSKSQKEIQFRHLHR
jgi:hypothetical protein